MRSFVVSVSLLSVIAACDLQPPPKRTKSEPVAPNIQPAPPPQQEPVKQNVGKPVTTEECLAVGQHFAQVLIDTATDPAEKAILEQEKTRNVRRQGETCEQNQWDDKTRGCFLAATTRIALQQCITAAFPGKAGSGSGSGDPAPTGPAPGSAAGSGSGSAAGWEPADGKKPATPPRPARPNRPANR